MKTRTQPRVAVVFNRDFEDAGADPENRAREDIQDVALDVTQVLQQAGLDVMSVGLREELYGVDPRAGAGHARRGLQPV